MYYHIISLIFGLTPSLNHWQFLIIHIWIFCPNFGFLTWTFMFLDHFNFAAQKICLLNTYHSMCIFYITYSFSNNLFSWIACFNSNLHFSTYLNTTISYGVIWKLYINMLLLYFFFYRTPCSFYSRIQWLLPTYICCWTTCYIRFSIIPGGRRIWSFHWNLHCP